MRVLVLGGYGFIGAEIVCTLLRRGDDVLALGRDAALGRRLLPRAEWVGADIGNLSTPAAWSEFLCGVDAIINAAGALQDSARDRLSAVHDTSIRACITAAKEAGVKTFVQISAPGANKNASTAFMRTKALADAALRASSLNWVIFRPGLVVGRNAYGGTALIRMLAGFPVLLPLVRSNARIQTVSVTDVTSAIGQALDGAIQMRTDYDLVEDEAHPLREILRTFRAWLGFRKANEINLPDWAGAIVSFFADIAGILGWRSPLRSTALKVLSDGIVGDSRTWRRASGGSLKSLDESLGEMPATAQERIYARVQFLLPLVVILSSLFWVVSGVIGITEQEAAVANLYRLEPDLSRILVITASIADIGIGVAMLWRPLAKSAAIASATIATGYVSAGTFIAPELWLDPLGVYVKVFPVIVLSIVMAALLQER